jgi:hypothetical protein
MTKTPFILIGLLGASALQGGLIYSNTTTDTNGTLFFSTGPYTEVGDTVTFAGTERAVNTAMLQFFDVGASSGTFDATLRFYRTGAPVGSQIGGNFVTTSVLITSGATANASFNLGGLVLPDTVVFTVAVTNGSPQLDIGLTLFDPPTVGSSDNSFYIVRNGSAFSSGSQGNSQDNLYFSVDASAVNASVPEPATMALMIVSVPGLLWMRRRRAITNLESAP